MKCVRNSHATRALVAYGAVAVIFADVVQALHVVRELPELWHLRVVVKQSAEQIVHVLRAGCEG